MTLSYLHLQAMKTASVGVNQPPSPPPQSTVVIAELTGQNSDAIKWRSALRSLDMISIVLSNVCFCVICLPQGRSSPSAHKPDDNNSQTC